jgi:hypothetical protein
VHNYLTGFREVGWDTAPIIGHFRELLGPQAWEAITANLGPAVLERKSESDRTNIVAAEPGAPPPFKEEPVFSGKPARPRFNSAKVRFGSNPLWLRK